MSVKIGLKMSHNHTVFIKISRNVMLVHFANGAIKQCSCGFMGGSHDKWSSDVLSVVYKVRITLGQNYLEVSPLIVLHFK
jgi:phage head maturation protease